MKDWIEIQFWKVVKWLLKSGYGYCKERTSTPFGTKGRCGSCNASDFQDFIDQHISLIKN